MSIIKDLIRTVINKLRRVIDENSRL